MVTVTFYLGQMRLAFHLPQRFNSKINRWELKKKKRKSASPWRSISASRSAGADTRRANSSLEVSKRKHTVPSQCHRLKTILWNPCPTYFQNTLEIFFFFLVQDQVAKDQLRIKKIINNFVIVFWGDCFPPSHPSPWENNNRNKTIWTQLILCCFATKVLRYFKRQW